MHSDGAQIRQSLWPAIESELRDCGFELVELEAAAMGSSPVLRIFIDKPDGGVTIDDCTAASHRLSPMLEELDVFSDQYMLEVSSPGIDRPIRRESDFERFAGEPVKVVAQASTHGRRQFRGRLLGIEDGLIGIECDGTRYEVHIENLKKANLDR